MSQFTEKDKLNLLKDLVKIESVNDNELEVCQYLHKLFQQHDINSEIIQLNDTRANLVAEIGTDGPVLGISGHMDVVAPGNKDNSFYPYRRGRQALR